MYTRVLLLELLFIFCFLSFSYSRYTLWYTAPATDWETQALPIGNGFIGAMVFGTVASEHIQFNDHTLWTGGPGETSAYTGNNPSSSKLAQINNMRAFCEQGNTSGANQAASSIMATKVGFGAYQTFGDIYLDCTFPSSTTQSYTRELDLDSGLAKVSFTINSVQYFREVFVSYPDKIMVIHLSASQPGKITAALRVTTPHTNTAITTATDRLQLSGALTNNKMALEAQFKVLHQGGTLNTTSSSIKVENADAVSILMAAGTDYAPVHPTYKGTHPHGAVTGTLDAAAVKGYEELKANHCIDYQRLFNAITLDLNQSPVQKPTDQQLAEYKSSGNNIDLEALFFQYGRYMLIASSRPGSLPANLQGIWNNSTAPGWSADYHVNINLQMNYWCADVTNIGETMLPLIDFLNMNRPRGRESAQLYFGAKGWTMGNEVNIFGFTGMHDWFESFYFPLSHAWLCQNIWDHFAFTLDTTYLKDKAYPILKETAEFVASYFIADKNDNNRLVSSPSYSAEHGNFTAGCSQDQQLAWDVLANTIEASKVLNTDSAFRQTLIDTKSKLDPGLRIGTWGQLQEWKQDVDSKTDGHRHLGHLIALYPGKQINPYTEPIYVNAVKVSLNARGDDAEGTGWGRAWRSALWARLFDGNRAYSLYKKMMQKNITTNLWDIYPPFQIDANLGATAAFAEMLLQSQTGILHLLPALPSAWPKGRISGFSARGGYSVALQWDSGKLTEAQISSTRDSPCSVKNSLFSGTIQVRKKSDNSIVSFTKTGDVIQFNTIAGQEYSITFPTYIIEDNLVPLNYNTNEIRFEIYDLMGRRIYSGKDAGNLTPLKVHGTRPSHGIYIMNIINNSQVTKKRILLIR